MASAVDKQPAAARLSAVAAAGCFPTATRGSQSSYTTLWDTIKSAAGANCQCQVVDINDKNKLKLPREWVERVLARQ